MPKHSLAVVCLLSLLAGGAARLVLHYAGRGGSDEQGIAVGRGGDAGRETVTESRLGANSAGDGNLAEKMESRVVSSDSAAQVGDVGGEARNAVVRGRDGVADGAGVATGTTGMPLAGDRGRAGAGGRPGNSRSAARGYARVSGGGGAAGGRGLAGHTVGGVKKTGEGVKKTGVVIGKTFGKLGGVFHD